MKSVLLGIGAMIIVSIVAWGAMDVLTKGADEANVSPNNTVRLN